MTSVESFLTKAPMTPRDVRRKYSNGRDFEVVFRNGYRNSGIWAERQSVNVDRFQILSHPYPGGEDLEFRYVRQHIATAQGRYIPDSMRLL